MLSDTTCTSTTGTTGHPVKLFKCLKQDTVLGYREACGWTQFKLEKLLQLFRDRASLVRRTTAPKIQEIALAELWKTGRGGEGSLTGKGTSPARVFQVRQITLHSKSGRAHVYTLLPK
jgi:hypothetical protein